MDRAWVTNASARCQQKEKKKRRIKQCFEIYIQEMDGRASEAYCTRDDKYR